MYQVKYLHLQDTGSKYILKQCSLSVFFVWAACALTRFITRLVCSYEYVDKKIKKLTFSKHSWPIAFGSQRTSKTREFGWLIKHHILNVLNFLYQEFKKLIELAQQLLADNTNHLIKLKCSVMFTAYRLLNKLFAHFITTSILWDSLDRIKSNAAVWQYFV